MKKRAYQKSYERQTSVRSRQLSLRMQVGWVKGRFLPPYLKSQSRSLYIPREKGEHAMEQLSKARNNL
jgi:hypothetical protein